MKVMEQTRAEAKQRARVIRSSQPELFPAEEMPHSRPIDDLRLRNLANAKRRILQALETHAQLLYEDAWDLALAFPLVWECDLKTWIQAWEKAGMLKIDGITAQRVPKLKANNTLVWIQRHENDLRTSGRSTTMAELGMASPVKNENHGSEGKGKSTLVHPRRLPPTG